MLIVSSDIVANRANFAVPTVSTLLITPRSGRQGLEVSTDADPVYLRLWTANAGVDSSALFPVSTSVWDIHIAAAGAWPGTIGGVVWGGGVSVIGTGSPAGRVAVVDV